jgi:hypothetical protein
VGKERFPVVEKKVETGRKATKAGTYHHGAEGSRGGEGHLVPGLDQRSGNRDQGLEGAVAGERGEQHTHGTPPETMRRAAPINYQEDELPYTLRPRGPVKRHRRRVACQALIPSAPCRGSRAGPSAHAARSVTCLGARRCSAHRDREPANARPTQTPPPRRTHRRLTGAPCPCAPLLPPSGSPSSPELRLRWVRERTTERGLSTGALGRGSARGTPRSRRFAVGGA